MKTIEDMKEKALALGGKCLSLFYLGEDKPLGWRCARGHNFDMSPRRVKVGYWCTQCRLWDKKEAMLNMARQEAESHGGRCLSGEYVNSYTPLEFRCKKGHVFERSWDRVKGQVHWCLACRAEEIGKNILERVRQHARSKGGHCLSETCTSLRSMVEMECDQGHRWTLMAHTVLYDKTWCKQCYGRAEYTLENLHKLAEKMGGTCLNKKYPGSRRVHAKWRCAEGHVFYKTTAKVYAGRWCAQCNRETEREDSLQLMQKWAAKRGGQCLSVEYKNTESPLEWACKNGHRFKMSRDVMKQKTKANWCVECIRMDIKKQRLKQVQQIAKQKGGRCLSREYKGLKVKMLFECSQGHFWKTTPHILIYADSWCPQCYGRGTLHNLVH